MFDEPLIGQNPSFSVSEFVAIFNQSLEMMYPQVAITGEISNYRVSKGKWVYFDLKDDYSSVKFFGSIYRLPGPMEDGITVEVFGQPRLHNQFGFSVNFNAIRAVGEGSIRKAQDLLLRKLENEGLFAPERKRSLPYPPERIGLITSAESAAIADFTKIINARWPSLKIELADTLVQGTQAPAGIVAAIQKFNMMSNPPEVLVIIRGGGSSDDLAAFSEESVVRAVSASRIVTMVAIGHENDVSLAELAADKRASTPSNAAELLVPDLKHEMKFVKSTSSQIDSNFLQVIRNEQDSLLRATKDITLLIGDKIRLAEQYLDTIKRLLVALDPLLPMQQGYALVRSKKGMHIRSVYELEKSKEDVFSLELTDGKKEIRVIDIE